MLRKEEILSRTNNGLLVFKHYLPGDWRIGRHFLNPFYQDKKASCNIYFDRHSGMYKMKDFGNDNYSGDCFFFVGQLKGLDCNRAADFVGILEIIDRDLGLGLASGTPVSVPPATVRRALRVQSLWSEGTETALLVCSTIHHAPHLRPAQGTGNASYIFVHFYSLKPIVFSF